MHIGTGTEKGIQGSKDGAVSAGLATPWKGQ